MLSVVRRETRVPPLTEENLNSLQQQFEREIASLDDKDDTAPRQNTPRSEGDGAEGEPALAMDPHAKVDDDEAKDDPDIDETKNEVAQVGSRSLPSGKSSPKSTDAVEDAAPMQKKPAGGYTSDDLQDDFRYDSEDLQEENGDEEDEYERLRIEMVGEVSSSALSSDSEEEDARAKTPVVDGDDGDAKEAGASDVAEEAGASDVAEEAGKEEGENEKVLVESEEYPCNPEQLEDIGENRMEDEREEEVIYGGEMEEEEDKEEEVNKEEVEEEEEDDDDDEEEDDDDDDDDDEEEEEESEEEESEEELLEGAEEGEEGYRSNLSSSLNGSLSSIPTYYSDREETPELSSRNPTAMSVNNDEQEPIEGDNAEDAPLDEENDEEGGNPDDRGENNEEGDGREDTDNLDARQEEENPEENQESEGKEDQSDEDEEKDSYYTSPCISEPDSDDLEEDIEETESDGDFWATYVRSKKVIVSPPSNERLVSGKSASPVGTDVCSEFDDKESTIFDGRESGTPDLQGSAELSASGNEVSIRNWPQLTHAGAEHQGQHPGDNGEVTENGKHKKKKKKKKKKKLTRRRKRPKGGILDSGGEIQNPSQTFAGKARDAKTEKDKARRVVFQIYTSTEDETNDKPAGRKRTKKRKTKPRAAPKSPKEAEGKVGTTRTASDSAFFGSRTNSRGSSDRPAGSQHSQRRSSAELDFSSEKVEEYSTASPASSVMDARCPTIESMSSVRSSPPPTEVPSRTSPNKSRMSRQSDRASRKSRNFSRSSYLAWATASSASSKRTSVTSRQSSFIRRVKAANAPTFPAGKRKPLLPMRHGKCVFVCVCDGKGRGRKWPTQNWTRQRRVFEIMERGLGLSAPVL